jgi:hypothetical protein
MKLYTKMPDSLKLYYDIEISNYQLKMSKSDLSEAWNHLERAHVIGQAYPYQHSYAHWKMLLFGIKIKNVREIIGQLPRLLVGGVKSFVGKIPIGNTGGANIHPLQSLPIQEDIKSIFEKTGVIN